MIDKKTVIAKLVANQGDFRLPRPLRFPFSSAAPMSLSAKKSCTLLMIEYHAEEC